jgi:hypothetical protein
MGLDVLHLPSEALRGEGCGKEKMVTLLRVIDSFETVLNKVRLAPGYSEPERELRMSILISWGVTLGNHGLHDFIALFRNQRHNHRTRTASGEAMDLVYAELGIDNFNDIGGLIQLTKAG